MRKIVIVPFLCAVTGLAASNARADLLVDSAAPTQYRGGCPTTLTVKGHFSVQPEGRYLYRFVVDQTAPQDSSPLSGLSGVGGMIGPGASGTKSVEATMSVYAAKSVALEVTRYGAGVPANGSVTTSAPVALAFFCNGSVRPTTQVNVSAPQQPPARPEGLTATASPKLGLNQTTSVRLQWQPPAGLSQVAGYKIERKVQGESGGFVLIAQIQKPAGNAPLPATYEDSGLDYHKTFLYRIKAHNQYGESPYSNQATVHTQVADIAGQAAVTKLAPPAGLRAQVVAANRVDLFWQVPVSVVAPKGFRIERKAAGQQWLVVGTLPVTNNQTSGAFTHPYLAQDLQPGATYGFRVCAFKDEAMQQLSGYSNEATATMPALSTPQLGKSGAGTTTPGSQTTQPPVILTPAQRKGLNPQPEPPAKGGK
jgi:hypothetical protein